MSLRKLMKPNAIEGYTWTEDDVLDEKIDALFYGFLAGAALVILIVTIVGVLT